MFTELDGMNLWFGSTTHQMVEEKKYETEENCRYFLCFLFVIVTYHKAHIIGLHKFYLLL